MYKVLIFATALVALSAAMPMDTQSYEAAPANELEAPNQAPDAASAAAVARPPGFPYYPGYPFFHSGYPFLHGAYPYHYPGNFPAYYPYFAPVVPQKTADPYGSSYVFHGHFDGHCGSDGLYYVDRRSFAFCHNGQRTVQSCAEGSANNDAASYTSGTYYTMNDFCVVNLLALTEAPAVEKSEATA